MRNFALTLFFVSGATCAAVATPVIDNTPTRVQTPLRVGLRKVGTLRPKAVGEVSSRRWTVDCASLDREQVDWRSIREYVAPIGIGRVRLQAGWARCEKEPGRYDFAWLDQAVHDAKRQGIDTWLELSYGNPAYPGGGGRQLSAGFPSSPEALAAWDRWVEAIVTHYKGVIGDFCVWNEPDNMGSGNTPEVATAFAIRTAEIVRRIVPDARIAAFALSAAKEEFVAPFVRELEARGKASLFTSIAYHHYMANPDLGYEQIEACRRLLARHAPNLRLWEGEGGTWSEWGGSGALSAREWTELTQAKYDLRRSLGDLGHDDDTSVFHLCDIDYRTSGFHDGLVRYGLIKTTGQAEGFRVLKVKMAYYAVQNAVSVFNDRLESLASRTTSTVAGLRRGVVYDWRDLASGVPVVVFWEAASPPSDVCETRRAEVRVRSKPFAQPVWVDVLTGDAYAIDPRDVRREGAVTVYAVPAYDSPAFITDLALLDLQRSWFVTATDGWGFQLRPGENVTQARFYGPFPRTTDAATFADLARLGEGREVVAAGGVFDFRPLCTCDWPPRGVNPDLVGFLAFSVDSPRAGVATVLVRNDWFGRLFVNGEPVGEPLKGVWSRWTRIAVKVKAGRNEVVFRTSPGSQGLWMTALGYESL